MSEKPKPQPPSRNPDMLTREEIEDLRREAKENDAYFKKVFAHLRPERLTRSELQSLRQTDAANSAYLKKAFAKTGPDDLTDAEIESLREDARRAKQRLDELNAADEAKKTGKKR